NLPVPEGRLVGHVCFLAFGRKRRLVARLAIRRYCFRPIRPDVVRQRAGRLPNAGQIAAWSGPWLLIWKIRVIERSWFPRKRDYHGLCMRERREYKCGNYECRHTCD